MNGLNRFIAIVLCLATLTGSVVTLLVATGAANPDFFFGWFESQLQWVDDADDTAKAVTIASCVAVALLMIFLLIVEIIPRHKSKPLMLMSEDSGIASIDSNSVCQLAETAALSTQNVRRARCSLKHNPEGGLIISCDVWLALGTNISALTAELQQKIRASVENLTGFSVAAVNVKSKYEQPAGNKRLVAVE